MTKKIEQVILSDSLEAMEKMSSASIDLVYLDPPFLTNRTHSSISRDRKSAFSFDDIWSSASDYADFLLTRLQQIHRILKDTGSVFVHCDKSANFIIRALLEHVFGSEQFRSEIIWTYKRWSNSSKGLMPAHQTIFFYSKTDNFTFNKIHSDYSETTNIDQILQLRSRDKHGVSSYAKDEYGNTVYNHIKKGVPLSDVWDIPFLNPKAKERNGYPTQKPISLLERIIEIATNQGDIVLDPFCGSGTTLVASKLLGRMSIGIDISKDAVELSRKRLENPEKTESALLKKGRSCYTTADQEALALLKGLDIVPVHRNNGIDAFLRLPNDQGLIPIRVQKQHEAISDAAEKLQKAAESKKAKLSILVQTHNNVNLLFEQHLSDSIILISSAAFQIEQRIQLILKEFIDSTYA